ncbi:MAG: alpha/beta hydrolase-fold protein [Acidobacteriota bacterium]
MKVFIASLFLISSGLAQTSVPCIPPPAPQVANPVAARPPVQGNAPGRAPAPQLSAADASEIAKLMDLPPWSLNLGTGDYSHGPAFPTAPELAKRAGVPEGKVIEFVMDSSESKFFPGVSGAIQRHVCVYVPAGYVAGTEVPVIVSADAYGMRYNLPTILDNMIYDQRVPAMAAVMIDSGGAGRSLEYDTVSSKYAEFVEAEVLPRAEREANVKLSKNPDARMTMGGSSGGAAALTMAWFHPDSYHRVLSYSGTFVNLRNGPEAPLGAYEYIEHLFPNSEKKPFRLWIQVSENDNGSKTPSEGRRNWVLANSRLAKILKDKGYAYQFVYSKGGGHTQRKVINSTLPQALEYLWLDYTPAR